MPSLRVVVMRINPTIEAAVNDYRAGCLTREITRQHGIAMCDLYRVIKKIGVPLRRPRHGKKWCPWCGETLPQKNKRFCNRECAVDYARDLARADGSIKTCKTCGIEIWPSTSCFCSDACRQRGREVTKAAVIEIKNRARALKATGLTNRDIAKLIGRSEETVGRYCSAKHIEPNYSRWTPHERELAETLWANGFAASYISRKLGTRSREAVMGYLVTRRQLKRGSRPCCSAADANDTRGARP
jgi:hypothetical protein